MFCCLHLICLKVIIFYLFLVSTSLCFQLSCVLYIWSDGCASQFRSRFFSALMTHFNPDYTIQWYYNERHHGKGPMDGVGGTVKNTVKPLNSGHLRVLKGFSVINRCPLLRGSLTKIVTFGTKHFVLYSRDVRYLGCPLLGVFTVSFFNK